jgi:hypothetical protein
MNEPGAISRRSERRLYFCVLTIAANVVSIFTASYSNALLN